MQYIKFGSLYIAERYPLLTPHSKNCSSTFYSDLQQFTVIHITYPVLLENSIYFPSGQNLRLRSRIPTTCIYDPTRNIVVAPFENYQRILVLPSAHKTVKETVKTSALAVEVVPIAREH